ncbi:ruBisCO large subunit-binding protein subunit alpha, chloroplastic-like [Gossypium australe]|uniref:RuBisCO large subunit-binding protein subunit alpha, chloroplastic-like n=1 Tax=Gossypium australe TaxID=47621 RepID=A0A5B6WSB6_9ROSI|nr:ruBisCO large subunit-binding protein subunit alpha, chloroplastic-like [Gossypium australe]
MSGACFRCGSFDYYLRDYPKKSIVERDQPMTASNTATRGRPPQNTGNTSGNRGATRDPTVRFEARAPARAYAIRAREEASSPNVITVSNPLGKSILVDKICKNCPLMTRGYCFSADLMLLPFDEFYVIMGMDWLTMHDTVVNCRRKIIELKCQNSEIIWIEFDDSSELSTVISSTLAQKCMKKGYDAYLAYILDTKVSESKIESLFALRTTNM